MKNLNLQDPGVEKNTTDEKNVSSGHLEFSDIVVYQEMSDQTSIRLNLIDQIHAQMNQLDEMISRKNFVMKEIYNEIVK